MQAVRATHLVKPDVLDSTTMGPRQQELSLNKAAIQTGDDRARPQETPWLAS